MAGEQVAGRGDCCMQSALPRLGSLEASFVAPTESLGIPPGFVMFFVYLFHILIEIQPSVIAAKGKDFTHVIRYAPDAPTFPQSSAQIHPMKQKVLFIKIISCMFYE